MADKGRGGYPSDVTDEEWAFVLPYLLLCREDSPQRKFDLRTVFNAVRYVARTGGQWRSLPHDLPPWYVVYQQMQRWLRAGCFESLVEDTRSLLREWGGRKGQPTAVVIDSRTLQSTPESGARAGYDGAKRRKGSKVHAAVDTLGNLLALHVTAANEQDRAPRWKSSPKRCSGSPETKWSWATSTRVTPEKPPRARPPGTASNWRWSNTPRQSVVSSCCRAAGWSSEASPGLRDSAGWPETMSDSPKLLPPSTTSPSHASCSLESSKCSTEVTNRL